MLHYQMHVLDHVLHHQVHGVDGVFCYQVHGVDDGGEAEGDHQGEMDEPDKGHPDLVFVT